MVHVPDAGLERRMMQEHQRRSVRRGCKRCLEPLQRRRIELAMGFARHARIQQHQIEPGDFNALVERSGRKGIAGGRECGAHQLAGIVVAGNAGEGQFERRQQALEILVFLGRRRIRQIARDHHEVGPWPECVQRRNTALQRGRGIDPAVGERSRRLDVQVGNLGDVNWFFRHRASSLFRGQQTDGVRRDRQPDPLAGLGPDGIRRIDGERFCRSATDDHALTITDKADAVDNT